MNTRIFLMVASVLVALPTVGWPQMDPASVLAGSPDNDIPIARGWTQFRGPRELLFFLFDVAVVVALTALIVYHPVRRKFRRTVTDLVMPRLFFLYSLVGMAVGFLVIQHGSMIGFVIFGIGALLRFRSNLGDPVDTVEMIIVTVLGLAVGLGLPVMALLVAIATWCFIWLGGRNSGVEISLKGKEAAQTLGASHQVEQMAAAAGWTLVRKHHVPGKSRVDLLYTTAGELSETQIEAMISETVPENIDLKLTV